MKKHISAAPDSLSCLLKADPGNGTMGTCPPPSFLATMQYKDIFSVDDATVVEKTITPEAVCQSTKLM